MKITACFAKDLFQGKTVFITGGGSGINLGIARNFAAVSANLGIVGRAQEKLDAAVRDLPRRALRQASQRFSNATTCGHRPSSRFMERRPATAASRRLPAQVFDQLRPGFVAFQVDDLQFQGQPPQVPVHR